MDRFELPEPKSMEAAAWKAIAAHRCRLEEAVGRDDRQLIVGTAKELVESIARVVLEATGESLGETAEFPKVVDTAQKQLGMRPVDLAGQPEVRAIAQSASSMIKKRRRGSQRHGNRTRQSCFARSWNLRADGLSSCGCRAALVEVGATRPGPRSGIRARSTYRDTPRPGNKK